MKRILQLILILCLGTVASATELTDLPTYKEGKYIVSVSYQYTNGNLIATGRLEGDVKKTNDKKKMINQGKLIVNEEQVSFTKTIDLIKNKEGLYTFRFESERNDVINGTIEILATNKVKCVTIPSGAYTLETIKVIDDKTTTEIIKHYDKIGTYMFRSELTIKRVEDKP